MGSSSMMMMEESFSSSTRRRKGQLQLQQQLQHTEEVEDERGRSNGTITSTGRSLLQVPSGDGTIDGKENGKNGSDDGKSKRRKRHRHRHGRGVGGSTRTKRNSRRRNNNNDNDDDDTTQPFYVLFGQVGVTLFFLCLFVHYAYRSFVPYDPHAGMMEELVYVVDDDENYGESGDGGAVVMDHLDPPINIDSNGNDDDNDGSNHEIKPSHPQKYSIEDEAKLSILMKEQKKQQEETSITSDKMTIPENQASLIISSPPPQPPTMPPLPSFSLSKAADFDPYGILNQMNKSTGTATNSSFTTVAQDLRQRFVERYGTENIARMLLDQGMTTFIGEDKNNYTPKGNTNATATRTSTSTSTSNATIMTTIPKDIIATACRFQQAREEQRPFRFSFGGYSVTAGRGNKFEQSFPFQLQRILEPAVQAIGIPSVDVINAAIGGCPAFPYGWCMTNFWGSQPPPDVVSWDYSMNEAGGLPEGLEAYVRHLLTTYLNQVPKLIVKDTYLASQRRNVLGKYVEWLHDPVVLHTGPAVKPFLERQEDHNPPGFQQWRIFGAPEGAPGQALHHPALKEHELMGWMLAMHFLTALEYLDASMTTTSPLTCPPSFIENQLATTSTKNVLPPPVTGISNTTQYEGILFGHEKNEHEWYMNPVHCRTSFQPTLNGDLKEIVVRGTVAEDLEVTLPKSQMFYNRGWTYDLSEEETQAQKKLRLYENGLGFVDSKEAYYGIYESPPMEVFIPFEKEEQNEASITTSRMPHAGQNASDWFESIIICQVNEKRDVTACNMGSDVGYTVGGSNATSHMLKETGTLYLGKSVCTKVSIPSNAVLTDAQSMHESDTKIKTKPEAKTKEAKMHDRPSIGVSVTIRVINPHIVHINQACSVSHIIWEQADQQQHPNAKITGGRNRLGSDRIHDQDASS